MSDISVVVCAHDEGRWNEIGAALRSLEEQTEAPREVVVVVDHNPRLLERLNAELGVAAVANTNARGLGGARNTGVAATSGSVVAFLDDDAMASRTWLALLREHYENPGIAAVGGGAEPLWTAGRPKWFPPEFDWVIGCSYLGMPEQPAEMRNLFGCNMSYRRDLLDALDGFRLGYGCDETELCIRLTQRWPQRRILYVPQASVLHHVPANRTTFRRFISRCFFEGGSKAVVAHLVGPTRALSSELRYTAEVLPRGVWRGGREFVRHGDGAGLLRAGAILTGLLSTAAGYVMATLFPDRAARLRGWSGARLG